MDASTIHSGMQLRGVGHRHDGGVWALRDVDLELRPGVTALVGLNGAGKSTLLRALSGAQRPTAGTVLLGGADLYGRTRRAVLPRVALMPQHLELPQSLTALDAVALIGWMRGLQGRAARARAEAALGVVGLQERATSRIRQLSGGMQRRVALAQALVAEPDVLLLDEPSTGLDPEQRRRMVEIVQTLEGAVLFSSHVMEDVTDTAGRILVLHEGRVLFDGDQGQLDDLAPTGVTPARKAEAAFLHLVTARRDLTR